MTIHLVSQESLPLEPGCPLLIMRLNGNLDREDALLRVGHLILGGVSPPGLSEPIGRIRADGIRLAGRQPLLSCLRLSMGQGL